MVKDNQSKEVAEILASAEMFFLNCILKNPKIFGKNLPRLMKTALKRKNWTIYCEKKKKKKGGELKCFGLRVTEDIAIKKMA